MSEGVSTQEPIAIQRFPLPSKGEFTQRFVRKHTSHLELYPTLVRVTHPERAQAIIGFAGFAQSHLGRYLQAQMGPLANDMDHTVANATDHTAIAVEWSGTTDIPDMRWRRLADYITEYHLERVVLFGSSFGGWEVLKGLSIFNRLATHEGFTIPPFTAIVAVAPTSGKSLQKPPMMDRKLWLHIKAAQFVGQTIVKLNGNGILSIIAKSQRQIILSDGSTTTPADLCAIAVRVKELVNSKPFQSGDFPEDTVIYYLGTDLQGDKDPFVNQAIAIKELEHTGIQVIPLWYEPEPKFPHLPTEEEIKRMTKDIINLIKRNG